MKTINRVSLFEIIFDIIFIWHGWQCIRFIGVDGHIELRVCDAIGVMVFFIWRTSNWFVDLGFLWSLTVCFCRFFEGNKNEMHPSSTKCIVIFKLNNTSYWLPCIISSIRNYASLSKFFILFWESLLLSSIFSWNKSASTMSLLMNCNYFSDIVSMWILHNM